MSRDLTRHQARKALTKFKAALGDSDEVTHLNITAMMDMMSILLVFMLKQFAAEQANMNLSDNLQLPKSSAQLTPVPSVNVTVTTQAIIVEGDGVVSVRAGAVDPSSKRDGPNGYYISPLVEQLQKHANRLKKLEALTGGNQKFEGTMLLLVDRSIPYRLVTEVLYSAGEAEFRNYRLVVLKSE